MAGKTKANQVPDEAKFLFKGTVRKLGASALAQVPKSEETAIVRVDEVLHAPPALAKTVGKEITVKLAKGAKPKVGDQVLFHANGWLFGKTVAVESVKQEAPALAKAMMAGRTADPTRNLKDRELENRVASADMVVEGEVSSVHLPESEMAATRAAGPARPVSEHDPIRASPRRSRWWCASRAARTCNGIAHPSSTRVIVGCGCCSPRRLLPRERLPNRKVRQH